MTRTHTDTRTYTERTLMTQSRCEHWKALSCTCGFCPEHWGFEHLWSKKHTAHVSKCCNPHTHCVLAIQVSFLSCKRKMFWTATCVDSSKTWISVSLVHSTTSCWCCLLLTQEQIERSLLYKHGTNKLCLVSQTFLIFIAANFTFDLNQVCSGLHTGDFQT